MSNNSLKYFGLDGDSIGRTIESYVLHGKENLLKEFSDSIKNVILEIKLRVSKNGGIVVFDGGDSILFKGKFNDDFIKEILELFEKSTGKTSSIGVGDSMIQAYLGLKLAKSEGGNKIVYYKFPHLDE